MLPLILNHAWREWWRFGWWWGGERRLATTLLVTEVCTTSVVNPEI